MLESEIEENLNFREDYEYSVESKKFRERMDIITDEDENLDTLNNNWILSKFKKIWLAYNTFN